MKEILDLIKESSKDWKKYGSRKWVSMFIIFCIVNYFVYIGKIDINNKWGAYIYIGTCLLFGLGYSLINLIYTFIIAKWGK